jgi:acyl carrier protein
VSEKSVKSDNEAKLRAAFIEALGIPATTELETLTYRGIKQWDSVAHMALVAALEAAFDVMLETADVIGMSSYPIARATLIKHGIDLA